MRSELSQPDPGTKRSHCGLQEFVCAAVGIAVAVAPLDCTQFFCMFVAAATFLLFWLLRPGLPKTCQGCKVDEILIDEARSSPCLGRAAARSVTPGGTRAPLGVPVFGAALPSAKPVAESVAEPNEASKSCDVAAITSTAEESLAEQSVASENDAIAAPRHPCSSPRSAEIRQRAFALLEESLDLVSPRLKKVESIERDAIHVVDDKVSHEENVDLDRLQVGETEENIAQSIDTHKSFSSGYSEPAKRLARLMQTELQRFRPPPGLEHEVPEALLPNRTPDEREILKLEKKLRDIEKLQQRRIAGETLERNQLEKIAKSEEFRMQIAELQAQLVDKAKFVPREVEVPLSSQDDASKDGETPLQRSGTSHLIANGQDFQGYTKLRAKAPPFLSTLSLLPPKCVKLEQAQMLAERADSCTDWVRTGWCPRGKACMYKHPPVQYLPFSYAAVL